MAQLASDVLPFEEAEAGQGREGEAGTYAINGGDNNKSCCAKPEQRKNQPFAKILNRARFFFFSSGRQSEA